MTVLRVNSISSQEFTFTEGTFSKEVSDFHNNPGFLHQRVYDDACDEGFAIRSEITGREEVFVFWEEHKNIDGDVTHWTYLPERRSLRTRNVKVIIWND